MNPSERNLSPEAFRRYMLVIIAIAMLATATSCSREMTPTEAYQATVESINQTNDQASEKWAKECINKSKWISRNSDQLGLPNIEPFDHDTISQALIAHLAADGIQVQSTSSCHQARDKTLLGLLPSLAGCYVETINSECDPRPTRIPTPYPPPTQTPFPNAPEQTSSLPEQVTGITSTDLFWYSSVVVQALNQPPTDQPVEVSTNIDFVKSNPRPSFGRGNEPERVKHQSNLLSQQAAQFPRPI